MIFEYLRAHRHKNIIKNRSIASQFLKFIIILFIILTTHTILMIVFEKLSLNDALWLTMTSATTVGYGDIYAKTIYGRISTVILLYILGISILAQSAAMYFEYRQETKQRILNGNWIWKMKDHIVFINKPEDGGEDYFYKAISGLRKSNSNLSRTPIIIICDSIKGELSTSLRDLNVVHVSKNISNIETLLSADVQNAKLIAILAKQNLNPIADSISFDLIHRLRELGYSGKILSEVVNDKNRERLKKAGADNVLRPIRAYPELLTRSIIAPGSEQIIETLFDSEKEECIKIKLSIKCKWSHIIKKLALNDLGIPLAYEDIHSNIISAPNANSTINAKAIFAIIKLENVESINEIEEKIKEIVHT